MAGGATRFVSLYVEPSRCPLELDRPTAIEVGGLLGHLMDHLAGPLDDGARERAEAVLFDLIEPVEVAVLDLPEPSDPRVAEVAAALRADPSDRRTVDQWGRTIGASGRTLARAVRRDTGLSFAAWRTQIRLAEALRLLADGAPVANVAGAVGYTTPSAFVAAFKRTVGATPGSYFG